MSGSGAGAGEPGSVPVGAHDTVPVDGRDPGSVTGAARDPGFARARPDRDAGRVRVALVTNGNAFSGIMLGPLFDAPDVDVAGAVIVRVPPGKGSTGSRLSALARRTGLRYAAHKAATVALPAFYGAATRRAVFVHQRCRRGRVPFLLASSANGDEAVAFLRRVAPDVLVSASTPQKLDPAVLGIPAVAAINVHWAELPRYAGIAPYFWVLRHGEPRTGLTVHVMAPELDVGPVLRRRSIEITPRDSSLSLQVRLAVAAGEELLAAVRELPASLEGAEEQDLSRRSYFTWPTPEDVRALRRRGRRLARAPDYRELLRAIRGRVTG